MELILWIILGVLLFGVAPALIGVQRRMDATNRKLKRLLDHFGIDADAILPASERVRLLVVADPKRKIEAIKAYREETGAGLAEAKAVVDVLIAGK